MRVTLHHNWFNVTGQRNPKIASAYVHAFNIFLRNWDKSGIQCVRHHNDGELEGECYADFNIFKVRNCNVSYNGDECWCVRRAIYYWDGDCNFFAKTVILPSRLFTTLLTFIIVGSLHIEGCCHNLP